MNFRGGVSLFVGYRNTLDNSEAECPYCRGYWPSTCEGGEWDTMGQAIFGEMHIDIRYIYIHEK